MPRFVGNPVGIMAWKREMKTKVAGMTFQPPKGGRPGKSLFEIEFAGRADVERAARVMFTEPGGGNQAQDGVNWLPRGEFSADDFDLPFDRSESRNCD